MPKAAPNKLNVARLGEWLGLSPFCQHSSVTASKLKILA
jgi:hypothetical protein